MTQHDLLESDEARAALKLPHERFELLVSTGELPTFRANGRICFRREDIALLSHGKKADATPMPPTMRKARETPDNPVMLRSTAASPADTRAAIETVKALRDKTVKLNGSTKPDHGKGERTASSSAASKAVGQAARPQAKVEPSAASSTPAAPPVMAARGMQRKHAIPRWLLATVTGALALIAWITFKTLGGPAVPAAAPLAPPPSSERPFELCVAAPGLVEASTGVLRLSFDLPGRLRVNVQEGQALKKGELIAELENADIRARVEAEEAELKTAEAQARILDGDIAGQLTRAEKEAQGLRAEFEKLKAGPRKEEISRAKAELKALEFEERRARREAQRFDEAERKAPEGTMTAREMDDVRSRAEVAEWKRSALQERLRELESGTRAEDISRAQAQLESAEADVARVNATRAPRLDAARSQVALCRARVNIATAELAKTQMLSPIGGVILRKYKHTGETVAALPRETIVDIADCANLQVRADLDEADYMQVRKGQRVKVTAEAFTGQFFEGTVERISNAAGQKRFFTGESRERMDIKVVEAIVRFNNPTPLMPELRVRVYFELQK